MQLTTKILQRKKVNNSRYIPHTEKEIKEMLSSIGVGSVAELFKGIPGKLHLNKKMNLPAPLAEPHLIKHLSYLSGLNKNCEDVVSFLGGGVYQHYIPSAVPELLRRSEWLTPYTPYQPELAQGTLTAIFEYQSMVTRLTGMEICNASNYDGSTGVYEACLMAKRITNKNKIVMLESVHPGYRDVAATVLNQSQLKVTTATYGDDGLIDKDALKKLVDNNTAAVVVQYPNFFGCIEDMSPIAELVHNAGGLLIIVTTEMVSLGLIKTPGEMGADIFVGEGQSFGNPMNFGGPHLGVFAAREKFLRNIPGRIVGQTVDVDGKRGFVLTMATREQHIRREKATSNICSNEALCALAFTMNLAFLGKQGLKDMAKLNFNKAHYAKKVLTNVGGAMIKFDSPIFNEFVIQLSHDAETICNKLVEKDIFAGIPLGRFYPELKDCLLVCVTEVIEKEEIDQFAIELKKVL